MNERKAAEWAYYAVRRSMTRSDVAEPLDVVRVAQLLMLDLQDLVDDHSKVALDTGASFGDVGRALGVTRQAARKRYGHLSVA